MVAEEQRGCGSIVVLTGAGVSADSGIATFRAADGLWEGHRVKDVATPEAFARDPILVQSFYNDRRAWLDEVEPNAAHHALAALESAWPGDFLLVTQNVDDLHERAGSTSLIHMHGQLRSAWCTSCNARVMWHGAMEESSICSSCQTAGHLRPDIVWFGEIPYAMDQIEDALHRCDLFVSIGTSGIVYPAAGFVELARHCGAHCVELNLEVSRSSTRFHESRRGAAAQLVPAYVAELLANQFAQSSPMS